MYWFYVFAISLSSAVHTSNAQETSFFWHTCKTYPVFKVSTECLIISWSSVLDNESFKKYFLNHFVISVLSAEFQNSRSEAHHKRTWRTPSLLDSYLYKLPSSAKIFTKLKKNIYLFITHFLKKICKFTSCTAPCSGG